MVPVTTTDAGYAVSGSPFCFFLQLHANQGGVLDTVVVQSPLQANVYPG